MSNKVFTSFKVVGILWSFDDSGFAYFSYMRFFSKFVLDVCLHPTAPSIAAVWTNP